MQVCIHRGSKEIGGSCVELISQGKRVLIDLGLPLDAKENSPEYLPPVSGLDGKDESLLGILISHPHLDHFGLLAHISERVPIMIGKHARNIIRAAAPFQRNNWPFSADGVDFENKKTFALGPFQITPYLIDHSAYDAYSLLIEADGKKLFYSGDFRIHGRKASLTKNLMNHPPQDIDVMLLEGTCLSNENHDSALTEDDIEHQLTGVFNQAKGLVMVHASAQNIDRIVSIFSACKKTGKKFIIDLYTAVILEATGNQNIPQSFWDNVSLFIPNPQRIQIKSNGWFESLNLHSANRIFSDRHADLFKRSVLLFRPIHQIDLEKENLLENATYIYSQYKGYWDQDDFKPLRDWLKKHQIPVEPVHTSGHATKEELIQFARALKAKKIIPIHTFIPEKFSELFENAELKSDGEYWKI